MMGNTVKGFNVAGSIEKYDYDGLANKKCVEYVGQTLSNDQKTQARTNIGAQVAGTYITPNGGTFTGTLIDKQGYEIIGVPNTYQAHNGIYRGKNLTSVYTVDQISAKIQANDWSDLYIGDYITKTISVVVPTSDYSSTETVSITTDWMFADFNYFKNSGSSSTTTNHIIMVPRTVLRNYIRMNPTHTTTGGYKGSEMFTTTLPRFTTAIQNTFGSSHVLSHYELLTTSVNASAPSAAGNGMSGSSNNWEWVTINGCNLLNETMVYGGLIFSSSGRDAGTCKKQLALFRLDEAAINNRSWSYWLSNVASGSDFCYCYYSGFANCYGAGVLNSWLGLRPFFALK